MDLLRLSCTQSSGLPVQMDDDQPFVFLYDNYSMDTYIEYVPELYSAYLCNIDLLDTYIDYS